MIWFCNDNLELGEMYVLYILLKGHDRPVQVSVGGGIAFPSTPKVKLI